MAQSSAIMEKFARESPSEFARIIEMMDTDALQLLGGIVPLTELNRIAAAIRSDTMPKSLLSCASSRTWR